MMVKILHRPLDLDAVEMASLAVDMAAAPDNSSDRVADAAGRFVVLIINKSGLLIWYHGWMDNCFTSRIRWRIKTRTLLLHVHHFIEERLDVWKIVTWSFKKMHNNFEYIVPKMLSKNLIQTRLHNTALAGSNVMSLSD